MRSTAEDMAVVMPAVMASVKQLRERAGRSEPQRPPDSSQRDEIVAQV